MRILASLEIPGRVTIISRPIFVQWRWYNYLRGLPIWALIVFFLVVPKENRNRQAWMILIPIGLLLGILYMPATSALMSPLTAEMVGFLIGTGVLAWSVVWLIGRWLGGGSRRRAFCIILGVMFAIGLLSCLCQFEGAEDLAPLLIIYGLCIFDLLLAMMITGYFCRKKYTPQRFLGLLLLWTCAVAMGLAAAFGILVIVITFDLQATAIIASVFIPLSLLLGGIIYLLNLPFLILAFNSHFYRKRLEQIFINDKGRLWEDQWHRHLDDVPLSTEPTGKPVAADDLVGRWQFYLDGVSKTVSIDFRPDGTFAQTISSNQGGAQQCPGGTWRLEGPKILMEGYITAAEGTSQARIWWMIDTTSGVPALFGGDGPDAQSFFHMRRRRPWLG
ncbi:MAG: hypothetical protein ABSA26_05395 [Thermoguttaceae bacterium]